MKRIFLCSIMVAIAALSIKGQPAKSGKTHFGVELNQFVTGSGFRSGTELYFNIKPDHRRNLGIGLFFDPESQRVGGIAIHHNRYLGRTNRLNYDPFVAPYLFYNLIYRKTTTREILMEKDIVGDIVTYTSLEHHLGVGADFKIAGNLYVKSELGYGVYLGSIKKPSKPDPGTGEITGSHGFGAIVKIGIGYNF